MMQFVTLHRKYRLDRPEPHLTVTLSVPTTISSYTVSEFLNMAAMIRQVEVEILKETGVKK